MTPNGRGLITLAFGSEKYLDMARALARSSRLHNPSQQIAIVSDRDFEELSKDFDYVIPLRPEIGPSLLQKLHMDQYSPFRETLFVDSDCLIYGDLAPLWSSFSEVDFGVLGSSRDSGTWFGKDLRALADEFHSRTVPVFNGGLMYWTAGSPVFEQARLMAPRYEELGFRAFRNGLPVADEPLVAVAMMTQGLSPIEDDYRGMVTPLGLQGVLRANVVEGVAAFRKENRLARPVIVHFCHPFNRGSVYERSLRDLGIQSNRNTPIRRAYLKTVPHLETGLGWRLLTVAAILVGRVRAKRLKWTA
jgi:hypothetical protein